MSTRQLIGIGMILIGTFGLSGLAGKLCYDKGRKDEARIVANKLKDIVIDAQNKMIKKQEREAK